MSPPRNRDQHEQEDQADTEPHRVLHESSRDTDPELRILHFNDIYHPQPSEEEPKGGAARFKKLCDYYRSDKEFDGLPYPLTLFSGDALNPSKESTVTKGDHMIPVLNQIGIDAACAGNHEFDFGAAHFAYLAKDCNFPWLVANMEDPEMGQSEPLGKCEKTKMIETSSGLKVGVIGLVEEEWTKKLNNSLPADLVYRDMKEVAKELAPKLREQGADIIVVLSHARQERDYDFCENLPAGTVDLVLGGHDHWVEHAKFDNGIHFVRSGFDFKNLSYVTGHRHEGKWDFTVVRRNLIGDIEEDEKMKNLQQETVSRIERQLENQCGRASVPLDARTDKCWREETNYGNFLADLMRLHHDADCALINGGTFMGDQIYPSGPLKLRDMVNCFPFEDPIVVMKVTGQAIWDAMENGVSQYPEKDSRFPHVSNIRCSFDPKSPVGKRVQGVELGGKELDLAKEYTIATRSHLAQGKCGYESIKGQSDGGNAIEVIDDENGILISTLLRQHFTAVSMGECFEHIAGKIHNHWDAVHQDLRSAGVEDVDGSGDVAREATLAKRALVKWMRLAGVRNDLEKQMREKSGELFPGCLKGIAPMVQGRVRVVGNGEEEVVQGGAEEGQEGIIEKGSSALEVVKSALVDGLQKVKEKTGVA